MLLAARACDDCSESAHDISRCCEANDSASRNGFRDNERQFLHWPWRYLACCRWCRDRIVARGCDGSVGIGGDRLGHVLGIRHGVGPRCVRVFREKGIGHFAVGTRSRPPARTACVMQRHAHRRRQLQTGGRTRFRAGQSAHQRARPPAQPSPRPCAATALMGPTGSGAQRLGRSAGAVDRRRGRSALSRSPASLARAVPQGGSAARPRVWSMSITARSVSCCCAGQTGHRACSTPARRMSNRRLRSACCAAVRVRCWAFAMRRTCWGGFTLDGRWSRSGLRAFIPGRVDFPGRFQRSHHPRVGFDAQVDVGAIAPGRIGWDCA